MKSAQRFPTDSISIIQEALTVIPNTDILKSSWNILIGWCWTFLNYCFHQWKSIILLYFSIEPLRKQFVHWVMDSSLILEFISVHSESFWRLTPSYQRSEYPKRSKNGLEELLICLIYKLTSSQSKPGMTMLAASRLLQADCCKFVFNRTVDFALFWVQYYSDDFYKLVQF